MALPIDNGYGMTDNRAHMCVSITRRACPAVENDSQQAINKINPSPELTCAPDWCLILIAAQIAPIGRTATGRKTMTNTAITTSTRTARINRKTPVVAAVPVTAGTEDTRREFRLACQNQSRADKRVEKSGVAYRVALLVAHSGNGGVSITSEQIDAARAEHHDAALDLPNAASMRTQWSWAALIAKVDGLPALITLAANPGDVQKRWKEIKAEQNRGASVGPGTETNDKGGDKAGNKVAPKAGDKSAQEVLADILAMSERLGRLIDAGDIVSPVMLQQVGKTLGKVVAVNRQNKTDRAKRQADAAIKA